LNNLNKLNNQTENEKANSVQESSEEDFKKYNNGRWHLSEHFRFIRGYILFGNNWKKVSNFSSISFYLLTFNFKFSEKPFC